MGHKVKVCMPCKQVYLPPNTGIDQRGNKVNEQGVAEESELGDLAHPKTKETNTIIMYSLLLMSNQFRA